MVVTLGIASVSRASKSVKHVKSGQARLKCIEHAKRESNMSKRVKHAKVSRKGMSTCSKHAEVCQKCVKHAKVSHKHANVC